MSHALRVLILLAAARFVLPGDALEAAGNPHNLGSCSVCHPTTPRFGIDTRYSVTFTTSADDPGLCSSCHPAGKHPHPVLVNAGSGPPGARKYLPDGTSTAFAGKIVCISCHFIHSGDTRYGLLRGFPGSPDPRYFSSIAAFCEECHGSSLASRSPHGGGEPSCVFCHAGQPPQERKAEIPPGFKDRCEVCHRRVTVEHFDKITPFGSRRECLLCHDRHGVSSTSPGLLSTAYRVAATDSVVIRPHFRRSLCFACHADEDDYSLRNEDVNALCDRCHASGRIKANIHPLRKVPQGITIPKGWPLTNGALTCLTCHDQGHEEQPRWPWMLHGAPYATPRAVCRACHSKTGLESSKIHQEISEGKSCDTCHLTRPRPGQDTIKTVTFIADPDLLCQRCHDDAGVDGAIHHGNVIGREMEDDHLPAELPLLKGRVICATCHDPHLPKASGFRLREYSRSPNYCLSCHMD